MAKMNHRAIVSIIVLSFSCLPPWPTCSAFVPLTGRKPLRLVLRQSSPAEDGNDVDELRRLLEASWNTKTMGDVPTSPASAADAAACSLEKAHTDSSTSNNVYFVDLHLPQYDVEAGRQWYDEVLVVEFCTLLADQIRGTERGEAAILVRNEKIVHTVNRVLGARSKSQKSAVDETSATNSMDTKQEGDDGEDNELLNDSAEFESVEAASTEQIDSFRDQLQSSWAETPDDGERAFADDNTSVSPKGQPIPADSFRLMSLFGDEKSLKEGGRKPTTVLQAVSDNVRISEFTDSIIVVSAASPEEMIAIRALVQKYSASTKIILVNCRLSPMPKELENARTVYSLRPLLARPTDPSSRNELPTAKVVLLRRFPGDWQLFIDTSDDNTGFELAGAIPDFQVDFKDGPSMQWIADCAKRHVDKSN